MLDGNHFEPGSLEGLHDIGENTALIKRITF